MTPAKLDLERRHKTEQDVMQDRVWTEHEPDQDFSCFFQRV